MVKSFDELCTDFAQEQSPKKLSLKRSSHSAAPQSPEAAKKAKRARIISDVVFYACLVMLLIGTFFYTQQGNNAVNLFGYKYYQVLTDSMASVYPRGSIVFVKTGDEAIQSIEVGDDMTFMVSATDTATHRVIEIIDNYEDTGMRAYRTQGVDNPGPDPNVTYENNVIGKVVGSIPMLGAIMSLISEYKLFILVFFVAMMIFSMAIRVYLKEVKAEKAEKAGTDNRKEKSPEVKQKKQSKAGAAGFVKQLTKGKNTDVTRKEA